MSPALSPQLAAVDAELERLTAEVRSLADASTDERFNQPPAPGGWSAAQCVNHLTVTGRLYLPSFDVALIEARARNRVGAGPFQHTLLGRLAIWNSDAPPKFKLPAPRAMRPTAKPAAPVPRDVVVREFVEVQREFQQRVRDAAGLDLGRVRMGSPLAPLFRLPLWDWFGVLTAHERRHVLQARKALGL